MHRHQLDLAGVLADITYPWDVPLMVSRGYASLTYLHSVAEDLQDQEKPCYLYHFGDHDPSGEDIGRSIEARLREFAPDAEIYFEKVAVTPDQIRAWDLPTRPTKKTDSRSKGFRGESVDVDAIPPRELRELCEECITQHIDPDVWERTRCIEEEEWDVLRNVLDRLGVDNG